jgi:Pentapeptide repeats (8 copies)
MVAGARSADARSAGRGAVIVVVVALTFLPRLLAMAEGIEGRERSEEAGRIRTALLALGAAIGLYYTARSYELSRRGQITERFAKAIEQLGKGQPDAVRLGAIYALERIARDSRDDHPQVMEVLTAYVRERARRGDARARALAVDVQAALAVIGRRELAYDVHLLDLSNTDLRGAKLAQAKLQRTIIEGANLEGVDLGLDKADPAGDFDPEGRGPLLDARFDAETKLPSGLTPERAEALGARQVDTDAGRLG